MGRRLTDEDRLMKRREQTKEFFNQLGLVFPSIVSLPNNTEDLLCNDKFMNSVSDTLFEKIKDNILPIKNTEDRKMKTKLNTILLNTLYKRKFLIEEWKKSLLYNTVMTVQGNTISLFQDTIIVDYLDDDGERWLDIDYPLYLQCLKKYPFCENFMEDNLNFDNIDWSFTKEEIESIAREASNFIEYSSLVICNYIFKFTKNLDDNSKDQILGNIGGLDDIKKSVQTVFLGELLSFKNFYNWYLEFLDKYSECIADGREDFILNSEKIRSKKIKKNKAV